MSTIPTYLSAIDVSEPTIQAAVERLLDEVNPLEVGVEVSDIALSAIPELAARADEDLRQTARAAGVHSLIDLWAGIRAGARRQDVLPPREGAVLAVELVRRGVDLGSLLRAWRLGHDVVEQRWEMAAERLGLDPELRWRTLARLVRFSFMYVDVVSVQLAEVYAEERARWIRGAAAVRAEMVLRLLGSEHVPEDMVRAALSYDVRARHVAFIVWADPETPVAGGAGSLEGIAATVAAAIGDGPSMLVPVGHWVVWGWVTVYDCDRSGPTQRPALPDGARVAVGDPAEGLGGFVQSHREARQARRVASLLGRRAGVMVRHSRVSLLALLSADPSAAASFVEAELGELAGESDAAVRLRATLRIYLEENSSPARTSRRLSVNKNTIVYRVHQAEEILGHPLAARRSELDAALRLAEALDGLRAAAGRPGAGQPSQPGPIQLV